MAKPGELNWDELLEKKEDYTHEPSALWAADQYGGGKYGVDPLNKSEKLLKPGEVPKGQSNEEIAEYILRGAPKQPTDEELFGHLVVTEEMAKAAQDQWENGMNKTINDLNQPVVKPEDQQLEWGDGTSFNDTLSEQERLKRNMHVDKDSL